MSLCLHVLFRVVCPLHSNREPLEYWNCCSFSATIVWCNPPPPGGFPRHRPGAPLQRGVDVDRGPRRKPLPAGSGHWRVSKTSQLWGVAHRTKPWAQGHTTTNPQDTPEYHQPGDPSVHVTHDHLSKCPETLHSTVHIRLPYMRTTACMLQRLPCISQLSGLQSIATTKLHPYRVMADYQGVLPGFSLTQSHVDLLERMFTTAGGVHAADPPLCEWLGTVFTEAAAARGQVRTASAPASDGLGTGSLPSKQPTSAI